MKFWKLSLAILIGVVMVIGLAGYLQPAPAVVAEPLAITVRPHVPYQAHYYEETSTDKWFVLVDLSDNTNFPHANTGGIVLKSLTTTSFPTASVDDKGPGHTRVGVVVTAPTTQTTDIEWIHNSTWYEEIQFVDTWAVPEHGLNLVVSGDSLPFVATNQITTTSLITSSTYLSATGAVSTTAAVGDLIVFTNLETYTETLRIAVDAGYDTE